MFLRRMALLKGDFMIFIKYKKKTNFLLLCINKTYYNKFNTFDNTKKV